MFFPVNNTPAGCASGPRLNAKLRYLAAGCRVLINGQSVVLISCHSWQESKSPQFPVRLAQDISWHALLQESKCQAAPRSEFAAVR